MIEIYNEKVRDLLSSSKAPAGGMQVREDAKRGVFYGEFVFITKGCICAIFHGELCTNRIAVKCMTSKTICSRSLFEILLECFIKLLRTSSELSHRRVKLYSQGSLPQLMDLAFICRTTYQLELVFCIVPQSWTDILSH